MRRPSWGTGLLLLLLPLACLLALALDVLHLRISKNDAASAPGEPTEITLYRFFGGCSDEYAGVTDLSKAVGECGVIQVLTNRFNAENRLGVRVRTQTAEWSAYYNRLSAALAAGSPPDVAVMHRSTLPDFVRHGLLEPLDEELSRRGVDLDDLVPVARQGVTFAGRMYALPFDLHALLWHLNVGLLGKAGLLDEKGMPRLPSSPEELLAHARLVSERAGARYFALPSQTDPMPSWLYEAWVSQQGGAFFSADLREPRFEGPAHQNALGLLARIYEKGFADPGEDYAGAEQAFLEGKAAVLVNGTWGVDSYFAQAAKPGVALKRYRPATLPRLFSQPSVMADSHVWVMPALRGAGDPRKRPAALAFLQYLFEQSGAWARTGHLPVRKSVLRSAPFLALPGRRDYLDTARIARVFPPVEDQRAIGEAIVQEVNATWLLPRSPEASLRSVQREVRRVLERRQSRVR